MKTRDNFELVYQALEQGNYSVAQQICEKPEMQKFALAQALLAYSYASQRKNDKALEIARTLAKLGPTDDSTVNALGCTFKLCHSDPDFALLYENALKTNALLPEHFHSELIYCYGRLQDWKKFQAACQRAYKLADSAKYLLWTSLSIVLQEDLPKAMLNVAEKMILKVFNEIRPSLQNPTKLPKTAPSIQPGAEELHLLLSVLLKLDKKEFALEMFHKFAAIPPSALSEEEESLKTASSTEQIIQIEDEEKFKENPHHVKLQEYSYYFLLFDLYCLFDQEKAYEITITAQKILKILPDQWNIYEYLHHAVLSKTLGNNFSSKLNFADSDAANHQNLDGNAEMISSTKQNKSLSQLSVLEHSSSLVLSQATTLTLAEYYNFVVSKHTSNPLLRGPLLAILYLLVDIGGYITANGNDVASEVTELLEFVCAASYIPSNVRSWVSEHLSQVKLGDNQIQKTLYEALLVHFLAYIHHFKTKHCCFLDLKPLFYQFLPEAGANNVLIASADFLSAIVSWSRSELGQIESKILISMEARVNARKPAKVEEIRSTEKAGVEEEDEEEEEGGVTTTTNTTTTSTTGAASGAAKKKKKKNNKKKKNAANKDSTGEEPGSCVKIDLDDIKQKASKDNELTKLLCSYAQLDYFIEFLTTSTLKSSDNSESTIKRLTYYFLSCNEFPDGVNGEKRTIQPGDELILLHSDIYRLSNLDGRDNQRLLQYLYWYSYLNRAKKLSPFNSAIKIDLLEVARQIGGLGQISNDVFGQLGPKYMQYDSIGYLATPNFYESGYYGEAARLYRCIVNFHKSCRKECLDMISRGLEHANYNKIMEVMVFLKDCTRSLHLALARSELPFLDTFQGDGTLISFNSTLSEHFSPTTPGAATPPQTVEEIEGLSLVSHLDYSILARPLSTSYISHKSFLANNAQREQDILSRIKKNNLFLLYLKNIFTTNGEQTEGKVSLDQLEQAFIGYTSLNSAKSQSASISFSQNLFVSSGEKVKVFDKLLVKSLALAKNGGGNVEEISHLKQLIESHLQTILMSSAGLTSTVIEGVSLLSREWFDTIGYFFVWNVSWITLSIQLLKEKSSPQNVIQDISKTWKTFLGNFRSYLSDLIIRYFSESQVSEAKATLSDFLLSNPTIYPKVSEILQESFDLALEEKNAMIEAYADLNTAQKHTLERYIDILDKRIAHLL